MNHYGIACARRLRSTGLKLPELQFELPSAHGRLRRRRFQSRIEARRCLRAVYGTRAARRHDRKLSGTLVSRRGSRDLLCAARTEDDFECGGRHELLPGLRWASRTRRSDLNKIEGGIIVRRARKGERLKTLDGIDRVLDVDDLIVKAITRRSLGLAGVMGGWGHRRSRQRRRMCWSRRRGSIPSRFGRSARRHGLAH